jgi:hypothetical protein
MLALPLFTQLTSASGMPFDLPTDVAYTDGTTFAGDVLNLVQLELEGSLDPIVAAGSSVNLAAGTSNSDGLMLKATVTMLTVVRQQLTKRKQSISRQDGSGMAALLGRFGGIWWCQRQQRL